MQDEIKNIISIGENTNIEFKLASSTLPKSIFETVCAFLNTAKCRWWLYYFRS